MVQNHEHLYLLTTLLSAKMNETDKPLVCKEFRTQLQYVFEIISNSKRPSF